MTRRHNPTGRSTEESRHARLYHWVMKSASSQSLSFGNLAPQPQHIARLRTAGLAATPTLAGAVMMPGMALRCEGAAW
jgi:hypothetical protein